MKCKVSGVLLAIALTLSTTPSAFAADTLPPQLVDWVVQSPSTDISSLPGRVVVKFILSDDSRINEPKLLVKSLWTNQMSSFASVKEITRSGKLVSYEATAIIEVGQSPGEWEWVLYPLSDSVGNEGKIFGPGGNWDSKIFVTDLVFTRYNLSQLRKCLFYVPIFNQRISKFLLLKKLDPGNESLAILKLKYNFPDLLIDSRLCSSEADVIIKLPYSDAAVDEDLDRVSQEIDAKRAAADAAAKATATKKTTITCVKGKLTKKVTAVKPKCPTGYKVKK
jgi:hypothetical protein